MHFTKCDALGNLFIVLINEPFPTKEQAKKICSSRSGPGADGIIHLNPIQESLSWKATVINCDGTDGNFSGNGLRCGAFCLKQHRTLTFNKLPTKQQPANLYKEPLNFIIGGQTVSATVNKETVSLIFEKNYDALELPLSEAMKKIDFAGLLNISSPSIACIDVGNPHLIINTGNEKINLTKTLSNKLNKLRQPDILLSGGINISIMTETTNIASKNEILLTTFERGVGLTPSCGSAAMAAFILTKKNTGHFISKGGIITFEKSNNQIIMTGNIKKIFCGAYDMVNNTYTKE